jgi:hypothetical protein
VELFNWFRGELLNALEGSRPPVVEARERIRGAADGADLGEALVDLLEALGGSDDDGRIGERLHQVFVEMADREVEALARAPQ